MKILVTGGAGFIGSNFVRRIVDGSLSGISDVTVLDKLTYAGTLSNLSSIPSDSYTFVRGDICDSELLKKILPGHQAIVNFAAESHVDRSIREARAFVLTNVVGVQTLLQAALNLGVETFVQISTDEVYGTIDEGAWREDSPLLPNSPYSASKASADLLSRSYFRTFGMDVRITRCTNNYGPNQFPEKIIPLFITNLIQGKKVPLYGSGRNIRDWLHVEDHCRAIHAVLTEGEPGEIYNIGGGSEMSNNELTSRILSSMNKDESSIEYVEDRLGHDFRYSVDFTKISRNLGYTPRILFEEGIMSTVKWYQEHESWWRNLKQ